LSGSAKTVLNAGHPAVRQTGSKGSVKIKDGRFGRFLLKLKIPQPAGTPGKMEF
jgi:hypothetical protein